MATGTPATMTDGLTAILGNIASLELAPDSDPEFLSNLRSMIATKIRETQAADLASQAGALAPAPSSAGAGPAPEAMGADLAGGLPPLPEQTLLPGGAIGMNPTPGAPPGAMGAGAPGPGRGVSPAPPMPDPDSLRRILNIG